MVWCVSFNHIPNIVELTRKTPKIDDKRETCKQCSMEALACTCKQPSVIKFLAIHVETMEAYTFWWDWGILWEMLDYNMKYSPIMDSRILLQQGGSNMESQTQLVAFRQNHVKLAWAFINIINAIHHFGILHNHLSKDNIMLHFLLDKPNSMYIGLYDLGEVECLQEVVPSLYEFTKE